MPQTNPAKPARIVSTQAPLAPLNLLIAGVPASEVVWFRRLKPDRQMVALRKTTRGRLLLDKVRQFMASSSGNHAASGVAA
jgi:hypothetical protein